MAKKSQIKIIHVLKNVLHLDDDDYRAMLHSFNVNSSTMLSDVKAIEFIKLLSDRAIAKGVWQPQQKKHFRQKYEELGNRPGYATPAQLRKIDAMWAEVSFVTDYKERKKALNTFLLRRFGVSFLEWLPIEHVEKVIHTLSVMKKQKDEKRYVNNNIKGEEPAGSATAQAV